MVEAGFPDNSTFPDDFRLGIADSDLQVVGEDLARSEEGSAESCWNKFSQEKLAQPLGAAVERFSRWQEDLHWFADLGVQHFRTSVSLARVLNAKGEVCKPALLWYRKYFEALRALGIKLYVTLYHWEMPQYAQDRGGWTNDSICDLLAQHAEVVHEHLGDLIEEYFAVNEPWCISVLGHLYGVHAPGTKDLRTALKVAHNVMRSVAAIEKVLHRRDPAIKLSHVGITFPIYAYTDTPEDLAAAQRAWEFYNDWYIRPLYLGEYPKELCRIYGADMPSVTRKDLSDLAVGERLHAFGMNYYNGEYVRRLERPPLNFECVTPVGTETNDLGWPVAVPPTYPNALYDGLRQIYHEYKRCGLSRLYVSENGMPQASVLGGNEEFIRDDRRIRYLRAHLTQVLSARKAGVPVQAYFL